MREKVRLSDLSVLFICLSDDWGTTERRCLSDADYFRNIGGSPFLLTHQKSLLDFEAERQDIPRLYFQGGLKGWRLKLNFYFQLQHILQKQQIDLIHTYNYDTLLPLGLILRSLTQIPMVFTFNENVVWKKDNLIDRWLISRTDSILTFFPNIKDLAEEKFSVAKRKIFVTGLGLQLPPFPLVTETKNGPIKIQTFVPKTERDLKFIKVFVDSIIPLFHKLNSIDFKKNLIFVFVTDISWYNHSLYDELKRMILERHLEMHFSFETKDLSWGSFRDCDIFVGLPCRELFSELDLYALVTKTPVLLPRTSTRQQMIKQGKLGETYHPEDGRELKDQLFKILTNYSSYLEGLKVAQAEFTDLHHFERYVEELHQHYEKLYTQRLRYTQKQKKLA